MDLDARLTALEARVTALERTRKVEPGEFERFWAAYPKKVGKKAALQAWTKSKDRPPVVDIIKVLDKYKQSEQWRKDGGQFIPNPSTWLNQGRWDDEPMQVAPITPAAYKPAPRSTPAAFNPPPDGWLEAMTKKIGKSMT